MKRSRRSAPADAGQGQHRAAMSTANKWGAVCALLVQACGTATPEAETPAPAAPAETQEPGERIADEADEAHEGDRRSDATGGAPAPAPEAPAADVDDWAEGAEEGGAVAIDPSQSVSDLAIELAGMSSRLEDALELASPDCDAAERFRDAVCSLSERICAIAQASALSGKCSDGRRRCVQSRQHYAERCGD